MWSRCWLQACRQDRSWCWISFRVHKGERVRQAIAASGCQILFLPAYSPDFAPIEQAFSKLKAWLKRLGARTSEALEEAIAQALEQISAQDAQIGRASCRERV